MGSNPAVTAKNFEIMIDWNKLIKCVGIVLGTIMGLVLICWGLTYYPIITTVVLAIPTLILAVMFLYYNT